MSVDHSAWSSVAMKAVETVVKMVDLKVAR